VPEVHRNYMHGEMVAFGLLIQLVLEKNVDEARNVAGFFANAGLPVHLGQISLSLDNEPQLGDVMEAAMMLPFVGMSRLQSPQNHYSLRLHRPTSWAWKSHNLPGTCPIARCMGLIPRKEGSHRAGRNEA